MRNLCSLYFELTGETRRQWDGRCWELADKMAFVFSDHPIHQVYIQSNDGFVLRSPNQDLHYSDYHMVTYVHNKVHCMYIEDPMRLDDYLRQMFPAQQLLVTVNYKEVDEEVQFWCGGNRHA